MTAANWPLQFDDNALEKKRAGKGVSPPPGSNHNAKSSKGFAMAYDLLADTALLRQLLRYEPDTGRLYWLPRTPDMFVLSPSPSRVCKAFNKVYAGAAADTTKNSSGYLVVRAFGRSYLAHRAAWVMHYGEKPKMCIDHINRDRTDNRIENLRDVSQQENSRNQSLRTDNKNGMTGLWEMKPKAWGGRWKVVIGSKSGIVHSKSFKCLGQAIKHRNDEYRKRGFLEGHGVPLTPQAAGGAAGWQAQ